MGSVIATHKDSVYIVAVRELTWGCGEPFQQTIRGGPQPSMHKVISQNLEPARSHLHPSELKIKALCLA